MVFSDLINYSLPISCFLLWLVSVLYFIYYTKRQREEKQLEISTLESKVTFLESELYACRMKINTQASTPTPKEQTTVPTKDDLKIVEGIGPKIESLLHNAGVFTFLELSQMSSKDIKNILDKAGSRFQMHDPTTWAEQAKLAYEGNWDTLKKWQSELDKGRIL